MEKNTDKITLARMSEGAKVTRRRRVEVLLLVIGRFYHGPILNPLIILHDNTYPKWPVRQKEKTIWQDKTVKYLGALVEPEKDCKAQTVKATEKPE